MGFSTVFVMLQAVYTTAEKEFRTIVFLIFDALCLEVVEYTFYTPYFDRRQALCYRIVILSFMRVPSIATSHPVGHVG